MAKFDDDTLYAMQKIYLALLKLELGMMKLAGAVGGEVERDVRENNNIDSERHALRNLDRRIISRPQVPEL